MDARDPGATSRVTLATEVECREPGGKETALRVFRDAAGAEWDVLAGRESWGMVVAIFVAREGSTPARQAHLEVSSSDEGARLLGRMTQEELQILLENSSPKPT